MSDSIQLTQKEKLGIITLNRPEVLNSFNKEMLEATIEALSDYGSDPTIRTIMLTGNGRAFCTGQDLQEAVSNDFEIDQVIEKYYNPLIKQIRSIEKPIIAAVNGIAAGAGANIAISCDLAFATESASFIQAFSKIGLIPDSGGTFTLPRMIG
ncbi:MAG: enoyl-CoA hydratase-related protein, partial [Bacteroidota bacterium]